MSLSTSLLSYSDCISLFDAALSDDRGTRLSFRDEPSAKYFVARMHQCRVLDRKKNTELYTPGQANFGRSVFDRLVCRIKPGYLRETLVWWVYVEHSAMNIEGFQRLSEVTDEALAVEAPPPRLLLAPPQPPAQGIKRRV